jgi:hypothetical protein
MSTVARHIVKFDQWFPALSDELDRLVNNNCSQQVASYHNASDPHYIRTNASAVNSCLLDHFPESDKFNFAVSAVLLGLLPTALGLLGSNPAEAGLLAYRRPLLALLLSLSSPVFAPIRAHEYFDPAKQLYKHTGAASHGLASEMILLVLVMQYVVAIGCVVSTTFVVYDLSTRTVCVWAPDIWFLPIIWMLLGTVILALGAVTVWSRVELKQRDHEMKLWEGLWETIKSRGRRAQRQQQQHPPGEKQTVLSTEWSLSCQQTAVDAIQRKTTNRFLFLAWFTSACTVFHLMFGTVLLSGALFIAPVDALKVAARFFFSTVMCRAVVMYELQGVRETWSPKSETN